MTQVTAVSALFGLALASAAAAQHSSVRPAVVAPPAQEAAGGTPRRTAEAGTERAPTEEMLGVPIYPTAQYLRSYDAGRGQRYYLFGATASFAEIVAYYRTLLKQRGDLVFERPATHMFEVGRYRADTMAFPPGVTVKDFTWGGSAGFPNSTAGAQPARFPTIIQIVPLPAPAAP